jgi:hypothetical protein
MKSCRHAWYVALEQLYSKPQGNTTMPERPLTAEGLVQQLERLLTAEGLVQL